jgi:riboflavin synthase
MFTGLIEGICPVVSVRQGGDTMGLSVDLASLGEEVKAGDSVAVGGVCLTATGVEGSVVSFEVSSETLARAKMTVGKLRSSSLVNIELAVKAASRFGGHFVSGHIDGTGTIERIDKQGRFANMRICVGEELLEQMVVKGSVAIDGVSLTIAQMDGSGFSAALIPETMKRTTLGHAKVGDSVNIETDIIVKTICKQLKKVLPDKGKLTLEKLKESGF